MSVARPAAQLADRWPEGVGSAFVAVPTALIRHAAALGMDDGHVRLLLALESFRRGDGEEAVWPSQATLADRCGCSVSQVERRVRDLRQRRLIEVERRARYGGKRLNHYTRRGLGERLAELEAATPVDPAPTRGTEQGDPASARAAYPASARASNPASTRGKEEVGEAEAGTHTARASAADLIAYFNNATGTDYEPGGRWNALVADRIREHPELTDGDFRQIINAQCADPWWTSPPSPAAIFSPDRFEQARQALRPGTTPSRRLTAAEQEQTRQSEQEERRLASLASVLGRKTTHTPTSGGSDGLAVAS